MAIICLITGYIKFFLFFTFLILFHEIGHIFAGIICKWKIKEVIIMPFGGLTIFNNKINHSLKEELFVSLSGPIFQLIIGFFIKNNILLNIHYSLLLFNLIPIYPLDGGRILKGIITIFKGKQKGEQTINIISIISTIITTIIGTIAVINNKNIAIIFFIIYIWAIVIKENKKYKNRKIIYELLEKNY